MVLRKAVDPHPHKPPWQNIIIPCPEIFEPDLDAQRPAGIPVGVSRDGCGFLYAPYSRLANRAGQLAVVQRAGKA